MLSLNSKDIRFLARMGSRGTLGQVVYDLAKDGKDFFAVSADVSYPSGFERLRCEFPERFVNVGIAEQNMIGIAAGLARYGMPVIATSWAMFDTIRAADQIRNYMGYFKSNIKLIGLDSGLTFAKYGYAHCNPPDIALLRTIPNIAILAPCDGVEIYKAVVAALSYDGPVYIRLTGGEYLDIIYNDSDFELEIGKAIELKKGTDIVIVASGAILSNILKAVIILESKGISCEVIDMHTIKPLDINLLEEILRYKLIVTVDEHALAGGLGTAIAEYYVDQRKYVRQIRIGIDDVFPLPANSQYVKEQQGLSAEMIADRIEKEYCDD